MSSGILWGLIAFLIVDVVIIAIVARGGRRAPTPAPVQTAASEQVSVPQATVAPEQTSEPSNHVAAAYQMDETPSSVNGMAATPQDWQTPPLSTTRLPTPSEDERRMLLERATVIQDELHGILHRLGEMDGVDVGASHIEA